MHIKPFLAAVFAGLLVSSLWLYSEREPEFASAQTETDPNAELVIFDDVTGPYQVKVTQSPARAITGTVRFIIEPADAETGEPIENAIVRIFGTPDDDGERQFSPGLNAPSDRTVYFGQLEIEHAGVWTIDVEIDADDQQALAISQTTVHERVRTGSNTLIGTILFILVSAGFVGVGVWLWYSSKRARARRDAIRRQGGTPRRSSG